MRDKGFNFFHTDKYCENLFAKYFEINAAPTSKKFELVTAFELFEHLDDPLKEINQLFNYSDTILFSTEILPSAKITKALDWWYFSLETGQHISFYTIKSLEILASRCACNFYTDGYSLHMLSKKSFHEDLLKPQRDGFLLRKLKKAVKQLEHEVRLKSLLPDDWNYVRNLISLNKV
jgi:hypothetical protein